MNITLYIEDLIYYNDDALIGTGRSRTVGLYHFAYFQSYPYTTHTTYAYYPYVVHN
jgi:hypothetical protein